MNVSPGRASGKDACGAVLFRRPPACIDTKSLDSMTRVGAAKGDLPDSERELKPRNGQHASPHAASSHSIFAMTTRSPLDTELMLPYAEQTLRSTGSGSLQKSQKPYPHFSRLAEHKLLARTSGASRAA